MNKLHTPACLYFFCFISLFMPFIEDVDIGLERVLASDPRVRVFALQYVTQKGMVLGELWCLPTSKTTLIDLKLVL